MLVATVNEQGQQHQQVRCQRSAQLVNEEGEGEEDKSLCTLKLDKIETPVSRLLVWHSLISLTFLLLNQSHQSKSVRLFELPIANNLRGVKKGAQTEWNNRKVRLWEVIKDCRSAHPLCLKWKWKCSSQEAKEEKFKAYLKNKRLCKEEEARLPLFN